LKNYGWAEEEGKTRDEKAESRRWSGKGKGEEGAIYCAPTRATKEGAMYRAPTTEKGD